MCSVLSYSNLNPQVPFPQRAAKMKGKFGLNGNVAAFCLGIAGPCAESCHSFLQRKCPPDSLPVLQARSPRPRVIRRDSHPSALAFKARALATGLCMSSSVLSSRLTSAPRRPGICFSEVP